MIERLLAIFGQLGSWGYLIVFLMPFLESAAFTGLLVPGETVVVLAGFLSSQGYLDLGDCLLVISLAVILGDTAGYTLGKTIGRGYFERHKRLLFLKEKHLQKTEEFFAKARRQDHFPRQVYPSASGNGALCGGHVADALQKIPPVQRRRRHHLDDYFHPSRIFLRSELAIDREMGRQSRGVHPVRCSRYCRLRHALPDGGKEQGRS